MRSAKAWRSSCSAYSFTNRISTSLSAVNFSSTLGGVFLDMGGNLAAGVDFVGSTTAPLKPDAVALYDISELSSPMLLARYNFPANQFPNANYIGQTVIANHRVYALDGNNGMVAFNVYPPVNQTTNLMWLSITPAGTNVALSWGNWAAVLQSKPSFDPTNIWADLTTFGQTNSLQPIAGGSQFYRLIERR